MFKELKSIIETEILYLLRLINSGDIPLVHVSLVYLYLM